MPIQKGPANLGTGSVDSTELSNTLDLSAKTVTYRTIVAGDIASNAITTAKIADANITPAKMANSGAEFGMKNRIINGDFRIWQRGTSGTSHATSAFGPDRWRVYGGNALTLSSSTSFGSPQSLLIQANNTNHGIGQRIEAANIADLAGQTVTISYKIRADNSGTHNFLMYYANSADNWSAETNFVNTAKSYTSNTVTTITHTVTLPAQAANGISVVFQWYNAGAAINITAFIWDVQLEIGSNATPFERRPYGTELALCQRYFLSLVPPSGNTQYPCTLQSGGAGSGFMAMVCFPVKMRTTATAIQPSSMTGLQVNWPFPGSSPITSLAGSPYTGDLTGSIQGIQTNSFGGAGYVVGFQIGSNASLIGFSAEL